VCMCVCMCLCVCMIVGLCVCLPQDNVEISDISVYTHMCTYTCIQNLSPTYMYHIGLVFITTDACTCAQACMVRAYAERETGTVYTCMCMAHVHRAHACAC
jgi:hypothetical protein